VYFGTLCEISDFIVVPSLETKNRLELFQITFGLHFPKIVVGYPGNNHFDFVESVQSFDIDSPYLLYISTVEPRKRHLELVKAFLSSEFPNLGYKLVLVGKMGWLNPEQRDLFNSAIKSPKINYASTLEDPDLKSLINGCSAIVMPSLDEGYGLSMMEGAYYGKPVLCSDINVFREITGGYATYISNLGEISIGVMNSFAESLTSGGAMRVPMEIVSKRTWKYLCSIWLSCIRS
jgi:glycosyltransferase involved in cell wall biosynthesis